MMRKLIVAAEQISSLGYQADPDVDATMDRSEDILYNLRHGKSPRGFVHIREVIDKILEAEPPQEEEKIKPSEMKRVPTGFTSLDSVLNGFQRSDLIVLAGVPAWARPLALNIRPECGSRA
jgi:replicative DNA helicase